jgi:hypothetical protein
LSSERRRIPRASPDSAERIPSTQTPNTIRIWFETFTSSSRSEPRVAFMPPAEMPIEVATPQTVPKSAIRSTVSPGQRSTCVPSTGASAERKESGRSWRWL